MATLASTTRCPVCGRETDAVASLLFPQFITCGHCGGLFLSHPASHPVQYEEAYFVANERPTTVGRVAQPLLGGFRFLRLRAIRRLLPGGRGKVLDYGAGAGAFVQYLRQEGIDAVGYDPSPGALRVAEARGIPVFGTIPERLFYLIMFWHSLEHTDTPLETLSRIHGRLAPGGRLLIAVPNAASWEVVVAGERWFHYDYPFHRVHFTPSSMRSLLEAAGFHVVAASFFVPEYTVSGLAQTFLNFFFPKNVLYSVVSHRRFTLPSSRAKALALISLVFLIAATPFLLVVFLVELMFGKTGAMVVIAKVLPKHQSSSE